MKHEVLESYAVDFSPSFSALTAIYPPKPVDMLLHSTPLELSTKVSTIPVENPPEVGSHFSSETVFNIDLAKFTASSTSRDLNPAS